jgi:hypothetical protein
MFHRCNDSNHLEKTNAYGSRMIHYDIVPKNLSKMEHDFHL